MKKAMLLLSLIPLTLVATACQKPQTSESITQTYTVSYIVDGKEFYKEEVESGKTATKPATDPVKEHYSFIGWYTTQSCLPTELFDFTSEIKSDLALYAGFEEIQETKYYTVTFELNGGEFLSDEELTRTIEEGTLINKPTDPFKNGYTFLYWASDETLKNEFNFETTYINKDITLYANYKLIEVNAKYEIVASSEENAGYRADFAADGNSETYWKAKDNGQQTLKIDLQEVKEVTHISQEFADLSNWSFMIEASYDDKTYVPLLVNDGASTGSIYERDTSGYYRYLRMTINENNVVATSKEFDVEYSDLSEGTNIAYGSKGIADCWAGGCETELMFDGKYDNYHCANQYHENHYMGIEMLDVYYVDNIEMFMVDATDHKFIIDYTSDGATWTNLETGDYNSNTEQSNYFKIKVNAPVKALLIHYNGNSTGNWPAMRELEVNGFKLNNKLSLNQNIIDLGSDSYLGKIDAATIPNDATFAVSNDNENFENVTPTLENGYYTFNKQTRYLKVTSASALQSVDGIKLYSFSLIRNLALLTKPVCSAKGTDPSVNEGMMTLNKSCKAASQRFYCSNAYAAEDEITLDLGINVLAENIVYKYQDYTAEKALKLVIQISNDGENYTKVLDTTDNVDGAESGQLFTALLQGNNKSFRYLKINTQVTNNWTNCNTLEINGIGSPIL